MTRSITAAVASIKGDLASCLDSSVIHRACRDAGHAWRNRLLDPAVTLRLLLLQVLHGNCACRTLVHLSGLAFSDTAYCKARARLPLDVLKRIARDLIGSAGASTRDATLWLGHRIFLIDGTGVSMPDLPTLQQRFGQPGRQKPGCGFPVMHLLVLFDHATGLLMDLAVGPWNTHDLRHAHRLHPSLREGDVLVGDRAFCSFAHLALLLGQNLHGVFRAHQRQIIDFTANRSPRSRSPKKDRKGRPTSRQLRRLGPDDQLVEWPKPRQCPSWMSREAFAELPAVIVLRELRYRVERPGFRSRLVTLVTTLLDPDAYPVEELASLYRKRWEAETNLRHLKQTMGMDVLRCRSEDGVLKELWAFVLVYNLVRLRMLDAAQRQGVAVDRVSFIDALDALRYRPPTLPPPALAVNPDRPDGVQPRVIKRRKDRYTYMTRPRPELLQELGVNTVAA